MADASLLISHPHLVKMLTYNPETGQFHRRVSAGRSKAGALAGTQHPKGYWSIHLDKRAYYSHRLAWFYVHAVWPEGEIDHINGFKGDNRISNLRPVSVSVNQQNRRSHQANNQLGFMGVTRHEHLYRATIVVAGKQVRLGRYKTPEEAHQVYLAAKRRMHEGSTI